MSNFRFSKGQWRTMLALTDAMLPNTHLPSDLTEGVVMRLEHLLRNAAWSTQYAFRFALFFIEYGTAILFLEWGRFSRVGTKRARHRFHRLASHRFRIMVLLAKLLKSLIQIAIYSDQRVERHFDNDRRAWRRNRFEFREQLLTIRASKSKPPVPQPLSNGAPVAPEDYLEWERSKDS